MAVYKKGKNWYVDYYVRGRRKRKKVGPSKKLALHVSKDVQIKIAKAEYLGIYDDKKVVLEELAAQYLSFSKTNKALRSFQRDQFSVAHLAAAFKGKYIYEITPKMIEDYKAKRLEYVGPATVNRELACLKHMYTKAIEWGYVRANPAKIVRKLKEPPGRIRYLRPDEVDALIGTCARHIRPIVVTALNTGMRRGEILSLKWSQVDLANRKVMLMNTKNNESRVVPINATLYDELTRLRKRSDGEYVFCGRTGNPAKDIRSGFDAAVARAGIKDFRFHDLRHTFGSHLVMEGVDLRTVQQLMGHKDVKMTMRYSHLSPEHVQEAVGKLDRLWTPYGHQTVRRAGRLAEIASKH